MICTCVPRGAPVQAIPWGRGVALGQRHRQHNPEPEPNHAGAHASAMLEADVGVTVMVAIGAR